MGLDLLVMPLWRYLAGCCEDEQKPDIKESLERARVGWLREDLEKRLETTLDWSDEGTVALTLQYSYPALQALRAFAAYQDHPLPLNLATGRPIPFHLNESNPEEHPSLLCAYHLEAPTRYPHLIDHSDCTGFYLPCDFASPVRCIEVLDGEGNGRANTPEDIQELEDSIREAQGEDAVELFRSLIESDGSKEKLRESIERIRLATNLQPKEPELPPKAPPGKHVVDWYKTGSSVRLLQELNELRRLLEPDVSPEPAKDSLRLVKQGWEVLHQVARVSVEKRLPIIFDG